MDKTILYLTDNSLDGELAEKCRKLLLKVSCGLPIVSVSQEPLDFGINICVGKIGRSGISMDTQILEGLKIITTKWVSVAEHDCVYSEEHFQFIPPDDKFFWYNDSVWLAQLVHDRCPEYNGMYSYIKHRRVMSQLVCDRNLFMQATIDRLALMQDRDWVDHYPLGRIGEPGTTNQKHADKLVSRMERKNIVHLRKQLKEFVNGYGARDFNTKIPNLDLRHSSNFTGQRRGKRRRWELDPWGRLDQVLQCQA